MKLTSIWRPEHPYYPLGQTELRRMMKAMPMEKVNTAINERNKMIKLEETNPLVYGHKLPHWKRARELLIEHDELLISGGHRGAKSVFCTDYIVDCLVNGPPWLEGAAKERRKENVIVACMHSSHKSSVIQQQFLIYNHLPPELRDYGIGRKENKHANVNFRRKSGFADDTFILPNGNLCLFFNYNQEEGDLEGYEYDLVWTDELVPKSTIEVLRQRMVSRRGKLLNSFVPVTGYTPAVKMYSSGSVVVESKAADPRLFPDLVDKDGKLPTLVKGCPRGEMPYVAKCRNKNAAIIYFHSVMNDFNPYDETLKKNIGKPSNEVKMRAYGYATKQDGGAFPKFGKHHILNQAQWLEMKKSPYAIFCVADPGGTKNWFIKWYAVFKTGEVVVFREFPSFQEYGEWAVASDKPNDYAAGPAQRLGAGMGIEGYKQLIMNAEGWKFDEDTQRWDDKDSENIEERIIDARFGSDARHGEGSSIIDLMEEEQLGFNGNVTGPRMYWNPARGGGAKGGLNPVEISVQMINEMMDYNDEKEVNAMNHPNWYVLEDCQQSIYAYQEYTGRGTEKDALKDIIDPDRYLVSSDVSWLDSSDLKCIGGGSY